jgi:hypothetical protein
VTKGLHALRKVTRWAVRNSNTVLADRSEACSRCPVDRRVGTCPDGGYGLAGCAVVELARVDRAAADLVAGLGGPRP